MSQADAARITGDPMIVGGKSAVSTGKIFDLADRRVTKVALSPVLRADVLPFDPTNPSHLRAWEAMYDLGQAALRSERPGLECGR